MTLDLTVTESTQLAELEAVVQRGLATFVDVGNALAGIRDARLYRASHGTFEEYLLSRWGMARRTAYRMIEAAQVVGNVSHGTQIPPANERQARELARLDPEEQSAAWGKVLDRAQGSLVTARDVQDVVDEMTEDYGEEDPPLTEEDQRAWTLQYMQTGPSAPEEDEPRTVAHVLHNSGDNEWYTPAEYIEAARAVMGGIDCDPASTEAANAVVKATTFYTAEQNGLQQEWRGRVWMNPPYAQPLVGEFADKLLSELASGNVTEALVLVNNATETRFFQALLGACSMVCLPQGRVKFWATDKESAPLQGQAVLYFGPHERAFVGAFGRFGEVLSHEL